VQCQKEKGVGLEGSEKYDIIGFVVERKLYSFCVCESYDAFVAELPFPAMVVSVCGFVAWLFP